jgi:hypothetical protein
VEFLPEAGTPSAHSACSLGLPTFPHVLRFDWRPSVVLTGAGHKSIRKHGTLSPASARAGSYKSLASMSLYKATKYCISVQHILLSLDISSGYAFLVLPKRKLQTQHRVGTGIQDLQD